MSSGVWILTPEHSISRHRGRGEEEKKREKKKNSKVVACGTLFEMEFVDFIYLFIYFLEFMYGQQSCRLWSSIWDGICQIFLYIIFFLEFVYGLLHVGLYLR